MPKYIIGESIQLKGYKHLLTIHRNAGTHLVEVKGQSWNLHDLKDKQKNSVREMIVDYWCRENGFAPVYGGNND